MIEVLQKNWRLISVLGLLLIASAALSLLFFGDFEAILVAIFLLAMIGILALILFRKRESAPSTAGLAIKTLATLATTFPGWAPLAEKAGKTAGLPAPAAPAGVSWQDQLIPLIVFLVAAGLIGLIAVISGRPPLERAKPAPNTPFRERTYAEQFARAARAISQRLDNLDDQSNWTDQYFVPLDAEVEEISRNRRRSRRIGDLLAAIKRDRKTRVFLVVGEPGSGKSTALRKLAKDLLAASSRTGILPLYVNLKEWKSSIVPDGKPPTANHLLEFISDYIESLGDVFVIEFFRQYLRQMIEHGRIFFIFDSFDEIPALLDQDETSDLRPLRAAWDDRRRFKALDLRKLQTRGEIAGALVTLESEGGRLRAVSELGLRSRQEGWRPAGEWPNARLPAFGDTASTELARLEEQWRGLDR